MHSVQRPDPTTMQPREPRFDDVPPPPYEMPRRQTFSQEVQMDFNNNVMFKLIVILWILSSTVCNIAVTINTIYIYEWHKDTMGVLRVLD